MQTKETKTQIKNKMAEWTSRRKNRKLKAAGYLAAAAFLTGALNPLPASAAVWYGWEEADGKQYWYEDGVRQGYDPQDPYYRGKEIYDPSSNAWYWLDNVQQGAKAVSKDVYQESAAGTWAENKADGTGKWVRYDAEGHMIKGWSTNENGTYYFDLIFGTMAKGAVTIDGTQYEFDQYTGVLLNGDGGSGSSGGPSAPDSPSGPNGNNTLTGIVAGDTYVLNTSTKKIHHHGCRDIKKILEKNYATCDNTLDSLYLLGYSTCGHCW